MKWRQSGLSLPLSYIICRRHHSPRKSVYLTLELPPITYTGLLLLHGVLLRLPWPVYKPTFTKKLHHLAFHVLGLLPPAAEAERLSKLGPGRHSTWEGRRRASTSEHSHDYTASCFLSKAFFLSKEDNKFPRICLQGHLVSAFISFVCFFKKIDNIMGMNIQRTGES